MASLHLMDCSSGSLAALERVHFFQRQLLTAEDMVADQDYFREKLRRHNRFLHGWGVVCGLEVTAAANSTKPWQVNIASGYALGPQGDEIFVGASVPLDLAGCGPGVATNPCEPTLLQPDRAATGGRVYVAIKYAECLSRPVRAMSAGCGCEELACEHSRVRDSFEIACLRELPPSPPIESLCDLIRRKGVATCPPSLEDPWVVLAEVKIPASPKTAVSKGQIDNQSVRRMIYSTALLQQQLIECCCGGAPQPQPLPAPAKVTGVVPTKGQVLPNSPTGVVVQFSKALQAGTVTDKTVTVTRAGAAVAGTVKYSASPAPPRAVFTPKTAFREGNYLVTVRGSGTPHIADVDGLALDGDDDGAPGGNFTSTFTVKPIA